MATGTTIGFRVLRFRRKADEIAWSPPQDSHLLLPIEVRDAVAPNYSIAKIRLNIPLAATHGWNWRQFIEPDDLVSIISDHIEPAETQVLFDGFVTDGQVGFDRNESFVITANGFAFRLARDRSYQVFGRYMASKGGTVTRYAGLKCSFNTNGKPNGIDGVFPATGGAPTVMPKFTYDHDPDATWWRAITAMEYLLWNYNADETFLTNPTITPDQRSKSPIVQVDVDGLSLWEALARIGDAGGYDVFETISLDAENQSFSHAINVVKRSEGAEVVIKHQAGSFATSLETLDTDQTNLYAARIAEATASCITTPVVLGGRNLYEITIELSKAWDPSKLAIPAGGSIKLPGKEKANATNPWVQRYWSGGSSFSSYAEVARRWDANTDGLFSGSPYSLSVPDIALTCGLDANIWPAMPYQAHPMLTKLAPAGSLGAGKEALLEISYDAGDTWEPLSGYRAYPGRLGVYLNIHNLAGIYPDGGDQNTDNLFQKLVDSPASVKIRLTCSIASPDRQYFSPGRNKQAGTVFFTGTVFQKGKLGQARIRTASSRFAGTGLAADTVTMAAGTKAITDETRRIQALNEDRNVEAALILEWIEDAGAPLSGVVKRIAGLNMSLHTNAGAAARYPRIVGRTFRLETMQTELMLDTDRQSAVV